jgi:predicted pyridoxine 5'-phosphate oxidase superfamily flavin-nucleotide-binding protein
VRSPYHEGEVAVQERAGLRASAAKIGAGIDDAVAPPAAHFLAQRYTLYVGSLDGRGRPWASELIGPPGFITVPDPRTVRIDAAPAPGDPLSENLATSPDVGLLAIDLVTRRRYRVNGRAEIEPSRAIRVAVAQAFGNCPKYIQRREPVSVEQASVAAPATRRLELDAADRIRIAKADTFFLATAHPTAGADVSHRGGTPGFVRARDARTVEWPDYQGNTMFMSLGNIAANPRAGLLFVDFETGDRLQLTGTARIDWSPERAATVPGAERIVGVDVEEVVATPGGSALRWRLVEPSPHNP